MTPFVGEMLALEIVNAVPAAPLICHCEAAGRQSALPAQ